MKSTTYIRYSLLIALAASVAACTPDKKAELAKLKKEQAELNSKIEELEKQITPDSVVVRKKDVSAIELAPRKFEYYVQTQGHIDAENNILVSAKSMGVITQVFVKEGQAVSKGQVLAQIDNAVIVSNIQGMKAQLELATSVFNRQKNLWDQKIGTEVQYLQAKTNKESLEKQLAALEDQNDMTRIKSPISGIVDEVNVKVGESIAPGQPAAARVVNSSDLKLVASVSEAYVTTIKKGDKVIVNIPELNKDITSTVSFVGKTIDRLSRTFAVEVKLPSEPNLRPNMSAAIKVVFRTESAAIVVPVNVVQNLNGEKILYVVAKQGNDLVARKRVVTVDGVYDNLAHVTGVNAGEKVITVGYQGLSDGQFIKL